MFRVALSYDGETSPHLSLAVITPLHRNHEVPCLVGAARSDQGATGAEPGAELALQVPIRWDSN